MLDDVEEAPLADDARRARGRTEVSLLDHVGVCSPRPRLQPEVVAVGDDEVAVWQEGCGVRAVEAGVALARLELAIGAALLKVLN